MNALFKFYESEKKKLKRKKILKQCYFGTFGQGRSLTQTLGGGRHLPSPPYASYGPVYHCIALKKIDL